MAAPMGLKDIRPTNNTARDTDVVLPLDLTPQPGSHAAPVDTEVSVTCDEDVNPTAVSAEIDLIQGAAPSNSRRTSNNTQTVGANTPLVIPYGNKAASQKLGARYAAGGWYAPPGVDLAPFSAKGWL